LIEPHASSARPTRVLCVDDNSDIALVLQMLIDAEPGMECVGCLQSADHLREEIGRIHPDIVLLDATMPGKNPLDAMGELRAVCPEVKIIVFSGRDTPEFIDKVINSGAWGYVSKNEEPGAIIHAIIAVAAGRVFFSNVGKTSRAG